jgi:hypothetical protein
MRSKKYGSVHPGIDDAPFGLEVINEDTYDRDNPPRLNSVAIGVGGTTGNIPTVTTAPHGIAIGARIKVVFDSTNSTPSIDGEQIVTGVSATVVSVATDDPLTVAATSGTMAILCDGVTYDPVPRIYKVAGVTKKFSRQVKYDSCGELYFIGPEVEIESCSSSSPYTMRSRKYGSINPTDTTSPEPESSVNSDTWDRFTPPIYNEGALDGVTYDPVPRIYKAAGVTKKFARQVKYDSCGEIYFIGGEVEIESCSSSNPYKMRDRRYGSANPTDTTSPLGLDQANTDTWDRFTPPIYNGTAMDGVTIGELPRHYISNSSSTYAEKIFDRLKKYDSCGELYYVGIEVLVETATISGSASKGGGI